MRCNHGSHRLLMGIAPLLHDTITPEIARIEGNHQVAIILIIHVTMHD